MKKLNLVRTIILAGSLLLQLSTLCFHARGAAGDVDLSFDPGSGVNGPVRIVALQPDGKAIIAGYFTTVKGLARPGIARLNADGSGDTAFNPGLGEISSIVLQSDGKMLVIGNNGYSVARLNSDGSYENSFPMYAVGGDYAIATSLAVQPDGKVLVGGYTVTETFDPEGYIDYSFSPFVTRDNANGSHDTSFIPGGVGFSASLVVQPDGKVLIGGDFGILRLNANGSLDSSFNPGGNGLVHSIVVQSDGKLLIGGNYIGNGTNRNAIARLNANGSLDGSFNPGTVINAAVNSVVVQSDGKVLIGGEFSTVNGTNRNGIARLNANGSLDNSFNPGTGASGGDGRVYAVGLQPDGKVLLGGSFTRVNGLIRNSIARLNADGSLDGSFQSGSGVTPMVHSLAVQPDGKTLIGGDFSTVQELDRSGIARLNADGSLDASFNVTLYSADPDNYPFPTVYSVAVQPNSKVLIGGVFWAANGTNVQNGIVRLNANGSLDNSFNPGVPGYVYSIGLQPDGKVLIGHSFGITRFNADGSLDSSFNSGQGGYAASIALQPDGKVLIGGGFTVNGTNRHGVARLNANGSLDSSFNGGAEVFGYVASVALQSNGKVLMGGAFPTVNGVSHNAIARLNANGSLDNSFNPDIGVNSDGYYSVVNSMVVQSDGKVLIGGNFGILRLNADGSLDANAGAGVTGGDYPVINSVVVQSDGKVLIGGDFTTVNGVARPYVARLYGDSFSPSLNIARSNAFVIVSWPVTGLNFQLLESTNLSLPNSWSSVAQPAVTNADQISVTVPTTVGRKFFRLKSQ